MVDVRLAHTAHLDAATLIAARALLYEVFDDMTEPDWEHCLGGLHALAYDGPDLVGHAALVQRRLLHGGRALRAGYVEGVAVRAGRRGRGYGSALMTPLEEAVRRAYDIGALGSTDEARSFYAGRGWRPWAGTLAALTPDGVVSTPDEEGWVYVLPARAAVDLHGKLTADWRDGDVW